MNSFLSSAHRAALSVQTLVEGQERMEPKQAFQKVALEIGTRPENVKAAYYYWKNAPQKHDGRRLLTDDEEEVLVSFMLAQDLELQPVNKYYMCEKVREWKDLNDNWDPWRWWKGFQKRNSRYFSCRQGKSLDKKRHTDKLVSNTEAFINWYQKVLDKHKTTARWILNADESPLEIEPRELIDDVCVGSNSKWADVLMPKLKGRVSVLPIVSASGDI